MDNKKSRALSIMPGFSMAEGVGFEPTNACASAVFKTAAFNHSATLPKGEIAILSEVAF